MLIRRDAVKKVGQFDSKRFFLYAEDQDYCIRMWRNGYKVVYYPGVYAKHLYIRKGVNNPTSKNAVFQLISTFRLLNKYNWQLTRN